VSGAAGPTLAAAPGGALGSGIAPLVLAAAGAVSPAVSGAVPRLAGTSATAPLGTAAAGLATGSGGAGAVVRDEAGADAAAS